MRSRFVIIALLTLAAPTTAFAQDSTVTWKNFDGWLGGAAVGVPGLGHEALPEAFTVALSLTNLRPRNLGADFWIGTMPRAFGEGVGVAGARANLVLPILVSRDVMLLPTAGVSAIGGLGGGGAGGAAGVNAGLSLLVGTRHHAIRGGVTYHAFEGMTEPIWLVEIGFAGSR